MASPAELPTVAHLVRLWGHECHRVFADRLLEPADEAVFARTFEVPAREHTGMAWDAAQATFFEDPGVIAARDRLGAEDTDRPLSFVGFLEGDPAAAAALAIGKGGGKGKGKKGAAAAAAPAERKQYRQASSEAQVRRPGAV